MREFKLPGTDGKSELSWYMWEPEGTPVAVVQIIHGMTEYVQRYEGFAEYLNQFGILVVGDDHMGHGNSVANEDDLGFFGSKDGWKHLIDDEEALRKLVTDMFPGVPYLMLGHSMGSFIIRGYMANYPETLDGAIVMGTAGKNPALGMGMFLIKLLRAFCGERKRSNFISNMAFGSYNKGIENPISKSAWLTRDDEIVKWYDKQPLCTFTFTLAGYEDLFRLLGYINNDEWYEKVSRELPILVTSGLADPVGGWGKGVTEVINGLESTDHKVDSLLYEGMRHEILNEIGKESVWADMKDWILAKAAEAKA